MGNSGGGSERTDRLCPKQGPSSGEDPGLPAKGASELRRAKRHSLRADIPDP